MLYKIRQQRRYRSLAPVYGKVTQRKQVHRRINLFHTISSLSCGFRSAFIRVSMPHSVTSISHMSCAFFSDHKHVSPVRSYNFPPAGLLKFKFIITSYRIFFPYKNRRPVTESLTFPLTALFLHACLPYFLQFHRRINNLLFCMRSRNRKPKTAGSRRYSRRSDGRQ